MGKGKGKQKATAAAAKQHSAPTKAEPSTAKAGPSTPRSRAPIAKSPVSSIASSAGSLLSPKVRTQLAKTFDIDSLDPFYERPDLAKRNVSQASALSVAEGKTKIFKFEDENHADTRAKLVMNQNLQALKTYKNQLDAEIDRVDKLIAALTTSWKQGTLDTTFEEYNTQLQTLEKRSGELLTKTLVISSSKFRLAGEVVDIQRLNDAESADDWSYIDHLIWRYAELEGAFTLKFSRDATQQEQWRKKMMREYDAYQERGNKMWCPILGEWQPPVTIVAAHIVSHNVPEWSAGYLFGETKDAGGHIWSTANGIPLHRLYEEMLDNARIAIVPTDKNRELQVIVLDKREAEDDSAQYPGLPTGKDLHGRVLKFQNDKRPALRYLYFAFAINILRRQRHEVPGWWKDRMDYGQGNTTWASPGAYLKSSMLRKLARRIGHVYEEDQSLFWGSPGKSAERSDTVMGEREDAAVLAIRNAYKVDGQ